MKLKKLGVVLKLGVATFLGFSNFQMIDCVAAMETEQVKNKGGQDENTINEQEADAEHVVLGFNLDEHIKDKKKINEIVTNFNNIYDSMSAYAKLGTHGALRTFIASTNDILSDNEKDMENNIYNREGKLIDAEGMAIANCDLYGRSKFNTAGVIVNCTAPVFKEIKSLGKLIANSVPDKSVEFCANTIIPGEEAEDGTYLVYFEPRAPENSAKMAITPDERGSIIKALTNVNLGIMKQSSELPGLKKTVEDYINAEPDRQETIRALRADNTNLNLRINELSNEINKLHDILDNLTSQKPLSGNQGNRINFRQQNNIGLEGPESGAKFNSVPFYKRNKIENKEDEKIEEDVKIEGENNDEQNEIKESNQNRETNNNQQVKQNNIIQEESSNDVFSSRFKSKGGLIKSKGGVTKKKKMTANYGFSNNNKVDD